MSRVSSRRPQARRLSLAFAIVVLSAQALPAHAAQPQADQPAAGDATPTIHAEEASAHARDRIAFTPGARVSVPFSPRAGDTAAVGGAAPRALPAGRRSGHELVAGPARSSSSDAVSIAPASEPAPVATPTPVPNAVAAAVTAASPSREVFGFLPYWELSDSSTRLDYSILSTIAYFGVGADRNGHLVKQNADGTVATNWAGWTSSRLTSVMNAAHSNGVRVVLTVQRFAWNSGQEADTVALLSSETARQTLANEIAVAVRDRGADGVNLDFEPIPSGQGANFVAFVRQVRAALDAQAPGYQLTFDATAYVANYDVTALTAPGAADAVVIMAYDFRTASAPRAGSTAPVAGPVYDVSDSINAFLAKTDASHIIAALPYYGRVWSTTSDAVNATTQPQGATYGSSGSVNYVYALPRAVEHGRRYDAREQAAWTVYDYQYCSTCPVTHRQLYYDDVESLAAKYDLVNARGLRGSGIWALGYDDSRPELYSLLKLKYAGIGASDGTPPAGTVRINAGAASTNVPVVRLDLAASDDAGGTGLVYARVSNSASTTSGVLTSGQTYPSAASLQWSLADPRFGGSDVGGPRSVHVQWRDVAGNWSPPTSASIELDNGPAVAAVSVAAGAAFVNTATVGVAVTQTGGRPIASVRLSNDPTVVDGALQHGVTHPFTASIAWSLIDAATGGVDSDGPHTVHVQWSDASGAWSAPVARSVVLDRVAPSGTVTIDAGAAYTRSAGITLSIPATDATSGLTHVRVSNDGTAWRTLAAADRLTWSLTDPATGGSAAEGRRSVFVQWRDAAGNGSATSTDTIAFDATAPAVRAPVPALVAGAVAGTSTVPVRVTWSATDAGSGVVGSALERRVDTGAWGSTPTATATSSPTTQLAPAHDYGFRVAASDRAGNRSAWTTGAAVRVSTFQSSSSIGYSRGWNSGSSAVAYDGSLRYSTLAGATARFTFTGRDVAWVARKGATSGRAAVYVDGAFASTVDLYSASAQSRVLVFRRAWATSGTHTIELRVAGTSGRPRVDLDAFAVLR